MSFKSSPLFEKDTLPVIECVQRVSGKSPMKMTVVIACMLLLVTKKEQFSSILTDLAFAGGADVNKNAPLTNASRHEFITAGLAPSASMGTQASQTGSLSTGGGANASVFDAAPPQDLAEEYLSMASDVALENSKEAKRRRAQRMEALKAKPRKRGARPPVPPATTVATGSVFVANGTNSAPAAGAAGGGPIGAPVVVTVLQSGNASAASQEATKTAPRQRPSRSRKATAGVVRDAPAAVRGGAAGSARGRARVPAGKRPAAPPLSTGDATVMPSAPPKPSVPAAAPIEPGGVARMGGSVAPNVVVGGAVALSVSEGLLPLASTCFPARLSDQPIEMQQRDVGDVGVAKGLPQSGGRSVGGFETTEEKNERHARVAAEMNAAQASLDHLLQLRYPGDAPNSK